MHEDPPAATLHTATLQVVTETIEAYAALTDDFNTIHVDPAFPATTPMGGVIAHGTMSLCLLWQALERTFGPAAFDDLALDIRFVRPVRVGETLTAGGQRSSADPACYDVWVRGGDQADRIIGSVRLARAGTNPHP